KLTGLAKTNFKNSVRNVRGSWNSLARVRKFFYFAVFLTHSTLAKSGDLKNCTDFLLILTLWLPIMG
ncbi:MAG: hypothetical protein EBR81_16460, partial [Proteobacteria bacterium]|nr:hypothetical protein [Pseudomonadota bacterium]